MIVGLIFGALTLRAMKRWAYYHHGGGCGAGGPGAYHGCGSHGGHRGRRVMYYRWGGAGGGWGNGPWGGQPGHGGHGSHGGHGGHGSYEAQDNPFGIRGAAARPAGKPIAEVLRSLELNERQQQEATPVLALAHEWLGPSGPRIEAALLAVASERFEPVLVEGLLTDAPEPVQREILEGLEHLHTILISEQREQLRTQLSRSNKAAPSTPPPSGAGTP
jgi:hypothetical protein